MTTISVELSSQNQITNIPYPSYCRGHIGSYSGCSPADFPKQEAIGTIASNHLPGSNISQALTLNEFLSKLNYSTSNPGAITIVSLNTSHPIPIHTSDSQKYYLIIGGKRRLIPDIQTLRYLEHKYNFNENRDGIAVPYSQITEYADGGSFTSVVISTRQAQQQLANLFDATQKDYTSVLGASSQVSSMTIQASSMQSQYKNSLAQAQSSYNQAVTLYNRGKQTLQNKAPYTAEGIFNQAKANNSQSQMYANQAKAYLSKLNDMKPKYTGLKNTLVSLKQKYQDVLGAIAHQLGIATSNEFIKANPSGLAQIQSTGSLATSKANSSINTINMLLQQLADTDISKVSLSSIAGLISRVTSQSNTISDAIKRAQQEVISNKASEQQTVGTTEQKTTQQITNNTNYANTLPVYSNTTTNKSTATKSENLPALITGATATSKLPAIFGSLDTTIAKELPENLRPYAKYVPYAIGGILLLLITRHQ